MKAVLDCLLRGSARGTRVGFSKSIIIIACGPRLAVEKDLLSSCSQEQRIAGGTSGWNTGG